MAKLADLVVGIGLNTKQLNKDLGKARREFKKLGSNFKSLGRDLSRNVSLPLAAVGAAALKSAADLERLETSFISLTGGAEQAAKMMEQLNKFTAETPFQIEGVADAAKKLLASGSNISEVNNQLQFLGDIAATGGHRIEDLAAIFAKVNAKGKVELESLNQLVERGIPIFEALADATGLLPSELGAGAVSVEQFNEALAGFAEEGGFAQGAMERLSQTASGQFSTALDALKLAGADLMQDVLPVITRMIAGVTNLAKGFTNLSGDTKNFILVVGGIATVVGPLLYVLPQIAAGFNLAKAAVVGFNTAWLASPVGLVVAGLTAVAGAVLLFGNNTNDAVQKNKDFVKSLGELDEEARRVAINTEIRLLREEKVKLEIAQRAAERQMRAGGGGEVGVGAMSRRGGQFLKFGEDVQEAKDRIAGLEQTLINLDTKVEEGTTTLVTAKTAVKELGHEVELAGQAFTLFETPQLLGFLNDFYDHSVEAAGGLEQIKNKLNELQGMSGPTFEAMSQDVEGFTLQTTDQLLGFLNDVEVAQTEFTNTTNQTSQAMSALGDQIGNTFAQLIAGTIDGNEAMRQIAGTIVKTAIAQAIANAVANGASSMSVENQASAGKTIPGNIAAALGAVMAALVTVPRFAQGGLVFGPGMAMVGDNRNAGLDPEVIAPLSKLESIMGGRSTQVYGRISGDDIVISNERASRDRNRFE
jgi:tape measure domain-containing protein